LFEFLERKKKVFIYIPLTVYWIILFGATSYPTDALPSFGVSDKVEHLSAFFILGILLNLTLIFQNKYPKLKEKNTLYTILIGSIYGIFDELHQILIPGRFCEFLDFVSDFSGLVLAVVFIILIMKVNKFLELFIYL
jgi:VanZ family protein